MSQEVDIKDSKVRMGATHLENTLQDGGDSTNIAKKLNKSDNDKNTSHEELPFDGVLETYKVAPDVKEEIAKCLQTLMDKFNWKIHVLKSGSEASSGQMTVRCKTDGLQSNESDAVSTPDASMSSEASEASHNFVDSAKMKKMCPLHFSSDANGYNFPCGDYEPAPTNLLSCNGLYVGNVAPEARLFVLRNIFGRFGFVYGLRIVHSRYADGPSGVFISYNNPKSPVNAIMGLKNTIFEADVLYDVLRPFDLHFAPSSYQRKYFCITKENAIKITKAAGECFAWRMPRGSCKAKACKFRHVRVNVGIDMPWNHQ